MAVVGLAQVAQEVLHVVEDHPFLVPSLLASAWAARLETRLRRIRRFCRQLAGSTTSAMSEMPTQVRPADPYLRSSEPELL